MNIYGKYKSWDTINYEYNLTDKEKFRWLQLVYAIPKLWLEALNKDLELSVSLAIYDHNLTKNCQLYPLDKLVSKELYYISPWSMYEKSLLQNFYEKLLETANLNWKNMHILPIKASEATNICIFVTFVISLLFWIIFPFRISYFSNLKKFH